MTSNATTGNERDRAISISDYWQEQKASGRGLLRYAIRRPLRTLRMARDTMRLPVLPARISETSDGRMIRAALTKHHRLCKPVTLARSGLCMLRVPAVAADYSAGSSKQTLRRKVRAAQKAGVVWRSIDDADERRALAETICAAVPKKARYGYTNDQSAFLKGSLWTAAFGPQGEPLVLAITPYDGEWALLQYFNSLGETQMHSDARYLLTQAVVERLSTLGVRHLFDSVRPSRLSAGLWRFQRMVGYEMARVRVDDRHAAAKMTALRPAPRLNAEYRTYSRLLQIVAYVSFLLISAHNLLDAWL